MSVISKTLDPPQYDLRLNLNPQFYILREIYKRTRTRTGSLGGQQSKERSQTKRFYATKMISWMVAAFLICTIPIMILLFLKVSENIPPKVSGNTLL